MGSSPAQPSVAPRRPMTKAEILEQRLLWDHLLSLLDPYSRKWMENHHPRKWPVEEKLYEMITREEGKKLKARYFKLCHRECRGGDADERRLLVRTRLMRSVAFNAPPDLVVGIETKD